MNIKTEERLYHTEGVLSRKLRVCYPADNGRLTLRTELDWDRSIEPVEVSQDGNTSTFELSADQPYLYFKPCLIRSSDIHWAVGPDQLLLMGAMDDRAV